jgi:plastocyanin
MSERHDLRDRLLLPIAIPVGALLLIGAIVFGLSRILLATEGTGAVIVALVTAAAILGLGALLAGSDRLRIAQVASMLGAVAGLALITGGVVSATLVEEEGGEGGPGGQPAVVPIAAPPGAVSDGFAESEVTAPADAEFTIAFDNQDSGMQHNVAIYPEGGDPPPIFSGQPIVTGPAMVEYDVPSIEAGTYAFICEVHPTTMLGTLNAEVGFGGGGGGGTIVAEGLAFDTSELMLPAGREASLTLDNRDEGTPHNVAIYVEEGGEPIFQGEVFNGPAQQTYTFTIPEPGEYYFQCDVHPQMNGTVVADGGGGGPGDQGGGGATPSTPTPSAGPSG